MSVRMRGSGHVGPGVHLGNSAACQVSICSVEQSDTRCRFDWANLFPNYGSIRIGAPKRLLTYFSEYTQTWPCPPPPPPPPHCSYAYASISIFCPPHKETETVLSATARIKVHILPHHIHSLLCPSHTLITLILIPSPIILTHHPH